MCLIKQGFLDVNGQNVPEGYTTGLRQPAELSVTIRADVCFNKCD